MTTYKFYRNMEDLNHAYAMYRMASGEIERYLDVMISNLNDEINAYLVPRGRSIEFSLNAVGNLPDFGIRNAFHIL